MSISLTIDIKSLHITFMINGEFKLGHHKVRHDYTNYKMRTTTGVFGLGFLSIYYAKTTHY
jgi:hypothetical protein